MKRPQKLVVIHDAVDAAEFCPDGPAADLSPPAPGAFRVALPGALAALKGHELLLQAALKLQAEFPSARVFFTGGPIYDTIGNQGYQAALRRSVIRKGLTRMVVFTGFQDEMAPWYRAMDVVVNASLEPEGFGLALLEAMACGRAVVGPRAGGIPEFVEHGSNGLLYEMGDAQALTDAISTLLRSTALRERLGAAARETASRAFRADRHVEAIAAVLHDAAARHNRAARPHLLHGAARFSDAQ